mmetsp:Transcript_29556/g.72017  ORF Transcript_29556/g.72017 Transcript_29556/m.72017 type:complete len:201 (+) Transcript_29556:1799-2401(+)
MLYTFSSRTFVLANFSRNSIILISESPRLVLPASLAGLMPILYRFLNDRRKPGLALKPAMPSSCAFFLATACNIRLVHSSFAFGNVRKKERICLSSSTIFGSLGRTLVTDPLNPIAFLCAILSGVSLFSSLLMVCLLVPSFFAIAVCDMVLDHSNTLSTSSYVSLRNFLGFFFFCCLEGTAAPPFRTGAFFSFLRFLFAR